MNRITLFVIIITLICGCKSIHPIDYDSRKVKNFNKIKKKIDQNYSEYQWFRAKTKVDFESNGISRDFTLHLKMRRDSLIWGSISAALGIEIARFIISDDSIRIIDRFNKKYYVGPLSYINTMLPINDLEVYTIIENLIIGNFIFNIDETFKIKEDKEMIYLNQKGTNLDKTICISKSEDRISGYLVINILLNQKFTVKYKGKITDKGFEIPKSILIKSWMQNPSIVDIELANIQFNKPCKFNFSIPNSYERME